MQSKKAGQEGRVLETTDGHGSVKVKVKGQTLKYHPATLILLQKRDGDDEEEDEEEEEEKVEEEKDDDNKEEEKEEEEEKVEVKNEEEEEEGGEKRHDHDEEKKSDEEYENIITNGNNNFFLLLILQILKNIFPTAIDTQSRYSWSLEMFVMIMQLYYHQGLIQDSEGEGLDTKYSVLSRIEIDLNQILCLYSQFQMILNST